MNNGVVIFAHNSKSIDYARISLISGKLAKKNLQVPVSLITDQSTIDWMKQSSIYDYAETIFDKIIKTERPNRHNERNLYDGESKETVPFINDSRTLAYSLTPYERTLLIDSDYLILNDALNEYWSVDQDVIMPESASDINYENRLQYLDEYISDVGIKLYWATAVMFSKSKEAETFFNTAKHIQKNYTTFSEVYRFPDYPYRNDFSFSVAYHIMNGFNNCKINLPKIKLSLDKDILDHIQNDKLVLLLKNNNSYTACSCKTSIHIMNKQSIVRNFEDLMSL